MLKQNAMHGSGINPSLNKIAIHDILGKTGKFSL